MMPWYMHLYHAAWLAAIIILAQIIGWPLTAIIFGTATMVTFLRY